MNHSHGRLSLEGVQWLLSIWKKMCSSSQAVAPARASSQAVAPDDPAAAPSVAPAAPAAQLVGLVAAAAQSVLQAESAEFVAAQAAAWGLRLQLVELQTEHPALMAAAVAVPVQHRHVPFASFVLPALATAADGVHVHAPILDSYWKGALGILQRLTSEGF